MGTPTHWSLRTRGNIDHKKQRQPQRWTLVNAQRVEPAIAEDPASALIAPAPPARRAAANAVQLTAASAPPAVCAKERRATPAAVSDESTSVVYIRRLLSCGDEACVKS